MWHLDRRCDAGLEQLETRSEAERIEGGAQVTSVLAEMRPAIGVQGNDHGIGERARGFNGIVGIHGEMKRTAGLRRARNGSTTPALNRRATSATPSYQTVSPLI